MHCHFYPIHPPAVKAIPLQFSLLLPPEQAAPAVQHFDCPCPLYRAGQIMTYHVIPLSGPAVHLPGQFRPGHGGRTAPQDQFPFQACHAITPFSIVWVCGMAFIPQTTQRPGFHRGAVSVCVVKEREKWEVLLLPVRYGLIITAN